MEKGFRAYFFHISLAKTLRAPIFIEVTALVAIAKTEDYEMRILPLLTSATFLLFSANTLADHAMHCFCDFDHVLHDGMGLVHATDCQISEVTDYAHVRGERGTFTKTLTFVGGVNQACGTLQVRKYKMGNRNMFGCTIWIEESISDSQADCRTLMPGNWPVEDFPISRRGIRACQQMLDEIVDEVFALPDCRAP